MNVLAVDTSGRDLTVALETQKSYQEFISDKGMKHSDLLLPVILDLCSKADIELADINRLVCTRGPGSFTGLRIGMASLKGIQAASSVPLISVSTLETFAYPLKNMNCPIIVALDARKQRYYLGVYKDGKALCPEIDGTEKDLINLLEPFKKIMVTGPAASLFAPRLKESLSGCTVIEDNLSKRNIGQSMILLSEDRKADHIGQGPVYIRKSDAEIMREEKQNG